MPIRKVHAIAWPLLAVACLTGCKRESEAPAETPAPTPSAAAPSIEPTVPESTGPAEPAPGPAAAAIPAPAAPSPVPPSNPPPAAASVPPAPTPPKPALPAEVRRVVGRWVRPDGGYVLDLKALSEDGRLSAAYLNPRPIHVSQARVGLENGQTRVFVELTDENYPGCTYTLTYLPQTDQLHGVYFQALMQESYEVHFVRETSAP